MSIVPNKLILLYETNKQTEQGGGGHHEEGSNENGSLKFLIFFFSRFRLCGNLEVEKSVLGRGMRSVVLEKT